MSEPGRLTPPARVLHALVRAYRAVAAGRPSPCRFEPSCSTYALEALEVHGAVRGAWLAVRRLARCHPWGGMGWDPVPPPAARRLSPTSSTPPGNA
ncbi:MAG: membrane protein insertion efficiency factor YidD [Acidimicrobiales bacterium]